MGQSSNTRRVLAAGFALLSGLLLTRTCRAAHFEVNPVTVTLRSGVHSADITITNQSTDPIRFSVRGYGWSQDAHSELITKDSDDILAFPGSFTVEAGSSQRVRIGVTVNPTTVERTFRVFFSELPPVRVPGQRGVSLTLITRVGVPVFVPATADAIIAPKIVSASQDGGALNVLLTNRGNTHAAPSVMKITANGAGKSLWSDTYQIWYVLASATRGYSINIPAQACSAAHNISLEWKVGGQDVRGSVPWSGALCGKRHK